jgi:hypothetical protein
VADGLAAHAEAVGQLPLRQGRAGRKRTVEDLLAQVAMNEVDDASEVAGRHELRLGPTPQTSRIGAFGSRVHWTASWPNTTSVSFAAARSRSRLTEAATASAEWK